ncbi:putative cyanate transporter [Corynebacterium occultum]|uniref:Putative cyanate transporter n=1 Tax=Corynebacterium occultum TaxID=2675219 RepID=A0A6B8W5V0_9CORY|nr:MFS transporter [Corynebacterium occultum]QGU07347.1 putative cyanate transporter [Corynebacterium occultum]
MTTVSQPSIPARQHTGNATWIVVVICGVIAAMHVWKLPSALTEVQADLTINLVQAGLLLGLVQLAGMLGGIPASILGERVGLRRTMVLGLALLVGGTVISALATTSEVMMSARILEGIGYLAVTVMAPALIRRDTPTGRLTRAMGAWAGFQGMATFIAVLGSSLLLQVTDWRMWYWIMAAVTAVGIPLLLKYAAPDPRRKGGVGAAFHRVWVTVRSWKPWVAGAVFSCYTIQWTAVIGFLPTVYQEYGVGLVLGGALSSVAGGVNAVGAVMAGFLLQRGFSVRALVITAFAVMGITSFGVYAVDWSVLPGTFIPQFVLVCVFSMVGALIPTSMFRIAVDLAPPGGSPPGVVGLMQQMQNTGNFLGPILLAWLASQAQGWHTSWWLTAAAGTLGVVLIMLFSEKRLGFSLRES